MGSHVKNRFQKIETRPQHPLALPVDCRNVPRMLLFCFSISIIFAGGLLQAEEVALQEEHVMRMYCRLPPAETWRNLRALRTLDSLPPDQEYSYDLWLPRGYLDDPDKRWPVIFIASPSGDARLRTMREWIVQPHG